MYESVQMSWRLRKMPEEWDISNNCTIIYKIVGNYLRIEELVSRKLKGRMIIERKGNEICSMVNLGRMRACEPIFYCETVDIREYCQKENTVCSNYGYEMVDRQAL